ncbi:AraC family transcriptional regulator [Sulfurimonas aquatica]|uniref:AraC family transcriptional regulator n=1 Tax=Sulfurimonas aquatica TaxID=2672570 RepID=A0A975AYI4_9BACT|nr:AraC family transcriptional regulator [Sulfurimonas aquatica]QSZ40830.1 AraC family transcriptional regulator [Sulfurimonas aquatica]
MKYKVYKPVNELVDIVHKYFVVDSIETMDAILCLPNGGNFLVFNRGLQGYHKLHTGKKFLIPGNFFLTVKTRKARQVFLDLKKATYPIICVELHPIGYYKLFNKDSHHLNKDNIELDADIVNRYFPNLYKNATIEDEIEYLNSRMLLLYHSHGHERENIENILDKIKNEYHFEVSVEKLAEDFNCSRKTMERQFKKIIGITPKNYIYIQKFCQTFLSYMKDGKSLQQMEYLYNDSSHFNAVFKNITGVTPSDLYKDVVVNKNITIYQMLE